MQWNPPQPPNSDPLKDRLILSPPKSLGLLDQAVDRVLAGLGSDFGTGTLYVATSEHPVANLGVTGFDPALTKVVTQASADGTAFGAATAKAIGFETITIDAGVGVEGAVDLRQPGPRGDLIHQDAMTREDTEALIFAGAELASSGTGLALLGEIGLGNTTVASALASALLDLPAEETVGLGAGIDAAGLARKKDIVTKAIERCQPKSLDPIGILAALGGPEFAVLTGITLGAACAGRIVIVDGFATSVSVLVALRICPEIQPWLVASHVSRERAHQIVLDALGLEPLFGVQMRAGEGVGACYGAQMILTAIEARKHTALLEL